MIYNVVVISAVQLTDITYITFFIYVGFLGSSSGKESACNAGDPDLFPGSGRSPREGYATHYSIVGLLWWFRQ